MTRPFVYVNMAASVDGKITSAAREYPTFTSTEDRKHMDRLRAEADAVLVGAGTLRADDPPLGVRHPEMQALRRSLGKPEGLLNVLVTGAAEVSPTLRFFTDPSATGRIVATTERAKPEPCEALRRHAEVWVLGRDQVALPELLARLHARGVERLLVEGGGELNWAFASQGLIDEINITLAPTLIGGRHAPTLLEGEGFAMAGRQRLELVDVRRQDHELFCRYRVLGRDPRFGKPGPGE